jgi:hypothetical protein
VGRLLALAPDLVLVADAAGDGFWAAVGRVRTLPPVTQP